MILLLFPPGVTFLVSAAGAVGIVGVHHFAAPFAFYKLFSFNGFIFYEMVFAAFRADINIGKKE